jgi:hypothetical protein
VFEILNDMLEVASYSILVIRRMTAIYVFSRTSGIFVVIYTNMSTPGASPTF